jgi:hypothetical protein
MLFASKPGSFIGLATAVSISCAAEAAQYQLGTPFPIACEGVLENHNGEYVLRADDDHLNTDSQNDFICGLATVAEESTAKYRLKYTLRENAIIRILRTCSLGKLCRIVGYVNGLSHDVYFWVKIDSVSAKETDQKTH